ncbi:MAG TPA: ferrochelatase [Acidimicrobiia bacterium]|nr:ferrochelatase [Acidimicrobiia bacterium]
MSDSQLTVLLAGFGGPESLDQVPRFVESVLGRVPPEHVIPSVIGRYEAIGGGSPLPATTRRQAVLVAEELGRRGLGADVHVGMLHARPTIEEAAEQIKADGVEELVVISLAPYRCEVSTDAYEAAVEAVFEGSRVRLHFGPDWNLAPAYVDALADMLAEALNRAPAGTPVVFAAHSLPMRMIEQGDPYADQLAETAGAVAARLGLGDWHLAYQSVSAAAREPWLGPSVEEVMEQLAAAGSSTVLVDPIGFISDHVETLYDNDVEHRGAAVSLGLEFHRCRCLNDHPGLIAALADLVIDTAAWSKPS